jgi:hypothetical protein
VRRSSWNITGRARVVCKTGKPLPDSIRAIPDLQKLICDLWNLHHSPAPVYLLGLSLCSEQIGDPFAQLLDLDIQFSVPDDLCTDTVIQFRYFLLFLRNLLFHLVNRFDGRV